MVDTVPGRDLATGASEHIEVVGEYPGVVANVVRAPDNQAVENSRWADWEIRPDTRRFVSTTTLNRVVVVPRRLFRH